MDLNRQGVRIIIENQNGEYLLHLRDGNTKYMPNQWCLIGGARELNETLDESAKREVKEETDLDTLNLKFFAKTFLPPDWDISIFVAEVDTTKQKPSLHEGKEIKFFSKQELTKLINSLNYTNPYLKSLKAYLKSN